MGYRIVYGGEPQFRQKSRLRLWTAVCLLIFVTAVRLAWPEGTEYLRQVLVPGEETALAFAEMVEHVGAGQGMGEALTVFCRTVVESSGQVH